MLLECFGNYLYIDVVEQCDIINLYKRYEVI